MVKSEILFILLNSKNGKAYDFIDSEYKAQDVVADKCWCNIILV